MRNYVFLFLLCLLVSCAAQMQSVEAKLLALVQDGVITQEQYDRLIVVIREAVASGRSWIEEVLAIGGSVILSLLGVWGFQKRSGQPLGVKTAS